jgi:hypothetical protein
MATKVVFEIVNGKLAFTLVGEADDPAWLAPAGKTVDEVTLADYTTSSGGDFSCQVNSGALSASPNTTTQTIDATFCEAEETITVAGITSYTLDVAGLQDANAVAGISRYLFEHDTEKAYFFLGFNNMDPPKAIGKVTVQAGTIGGAARTRPLTFDLTLPVDGKPQVDFGTATDHEPVPPSEEITGPDRASASPGDVFPADPDITAQDQTNADKLTAEGFIADPQTLWLYAQQMNVGPYAFHWSGTAWAPGPSAGTPATGATAGAPGVWTPAGSKPPDDTADLIAGVPNAVTASPATAWTTGQHVECVDAATAHWNGTAWVAGLAP